MWFNDGFFPKAVSRTAPTPITLGLSASPRSLDGVHLPALEELTFKFDKSVALGTKGLPVCNPTIQHLDEMRIMEDRCKTALVGEGTMSVEIAFPEQAPIVSGEKMVLWNGGTENGVTRLYAKAYLTVPTPAALISTIDIRKISEGRFGTEMTISIPKIAGGSGSVTSFEARIDRHFLNRGRPASVATLKCPPDRKVQTSASAKFADGTHLGVEMVRPCIAKP
jgi:hypothetical protein